MNKTLLTTLAALLIPALAASARAQTLELGGGVGVAGVAWAGSSTGGDIRVSLPVGSQRDLEFFGGLLTREMNDARGFYAFQFRKRLGGDRTDRVHAFLTYGLLGPIGRVEQTTLVFPPFAGLVGGGLDARVLPRLKLRVDVQAIAVVIPVGVRVAAGFSIPVGHVPTTARSAWPR
jgi:hypothetical protein